MVKLVPLGIMALLLPSAIEAQMFQPSLLMGPQISLQAHAAASSSRSRPPARTQVTSVQSVDLTYSPNLAQRRANYAQFVARTRAVDPAGARSLAATLAEHDIVDEIGKLVAPHGLRIDNVADAYALYWINAYEAWRGGNPTPSPAKLTAVREQARRALVASERFRTASNAAKQEMAEALWVQAAMLDVGVEQAKGKPDKLAAMSKAAARGAQAMGLDVTRMTLSETGFRSE